MIEFVDTAPQVNVRPDEYRRLLGYPTDHEPSDRAHELAEWAADWYACNGRPWIYAREAGDVELHADSIHIEGAVFHSGRLQGTLEKALAHGAILVAAGAGVELEQEAQRLWKDGKPDEYFFLEVFGSAVVEHLTHMTGARLCAWADERQMAVLPHYSPGYPEWDIGEQSKLLDLIRISAAHPLPYHLEALESGALRPKKSQLAVFGYTRHTELVRRLTELIPCENCSFLPCQFRRAPNGELTAQNGRVQQNGAAATFHFIAGTAATNGRRNGIPTPAPAYTVKAKALKRWAEERLSLDRRADGVTHAIFHYEGTTCSNMGRPLLFDYHVDLGPREDGYPIREQRCAPAPGDTGHAHMCKHMENPSLLSNAIASEKPCLGQPLSAVLAWQRPTCAPGCYCEPASREHKWGIVLETIHYALARQALAHHGKKL
jgi:hypothetical protein